MKQREVQGSDGVTWVCVQAYTGLTHSQKNEEAAKAAGEGGKVKVVCTPSGGAQTVRLDLPVTWVEDVSDEELLQEIQANRP